MPIEALPAAAEKLEILHMSIDELTKNGYVFIGMDHFAKPNDELSIAKHKVKCTVISKAIPPSQNQIY